MAEYRVEDRFSKISFIVALIAITLGGLFGITQLITRTTGFPDLVEPREYYAVLTGHGVLMAIVWTTFFIMGISTYIVVRELKTRFRPALLNVALAMTILGTAMAAIPILLGQASVLYTFYPPMKAHWAFYLGAAILIVGTWVYAAALFDVFLRWRRANPGVSIPVPTYGILATFIIWLMATPPVAVEVLLLLLPMSLFDMSVDVVLARTLFWWFGHPLVYFWLLPAVALWYYAVPRLLGVKLFSETMAKAAFVLFIIASTPVGLHHQFVDPGVSAVYKFIHTILTFVVATPSMLTAFNILATMESGGRARGGNGVIGWLFKLPWRDPLFAGISMAILLFGIGGIGGIVNASFQLNVVVHNTLWVVGHFHTTVGGATTLTFIAAFFVLVRELYGRELVSKTLALAQPYLWFIGMAIFSLAYHWLGLLGAPRRTADIYYAGAAPSSWTLLEQVAAIGAIVLWTAGAIFVAVVVLSLLRGKRISLRPEDMILRFNYDPKPASGIMLESIGVWVGVAIILIILGYSLPLYEIFSRGLSPAPPYPTG